MCKKLLIFSFLILSAISAIAQKERVENLPNFDKDRFHYGFYLGLNQNGFKVAYKPSFVNQPNVIVQPSIGFNVGLIADLKLHPNINLRFEPGLVSNNKVLIFDHIPGNDDFLREREAGNTYLHLPLIFKFSTNRLNNVRPYVLAGVSYDHNFSSNESNGDDNFAGEFRQKTTNFMYELGIGIDIYLPYFKFSPSIRGLFAINNELKYDSRTPSQWTDPIDYMGTRGIFLHLAFE